MTIDYDSLERMHKQEGWTPDQQRHFEHGWEAGQRALYKAIRDDHEDKLSELLTYANTVFEKPGQEPPDGKRPPFFPITVEAASQWLHANLPPEELMLLVDLAPCQLHHSLGREIRNMMGLWAGNSFLRQDAEHYFKGTRVPAGEPGGSHLSDGYLHPDEVSNIIIMHLQDQLRRLKAAGLFKEIKS